MNPTDSHEKDHSSRLKIWAKSILYNVGLQLVLRMVTFVANAYIVRLLSRETLGLVNVRILLFYTTVQFLSREGFRRTCFSSFKQGSSELQVAFTNLSFCSVPLSLLFGSLLWYIWARRLELPNASISSEYENTLSLVLISVVIELLVESFYVYGQRNDYIKLKVVIEGIFQFVRVLGLTLIAFYSPNNAILGFGLSQMAASISYSLSYVIYFTILDKRKFSLFLPSLNGQSIQQTVMLFGTSFQFLMNTFGKQMVTEGERYLMAILTIIPFAEQGIYDVINNLASLPARLIFQQVEDNSNRLFSGLIKRDLEYDKQRDATEKALSILIILCRFMLIIGLLIFVYGFNFSELALYFYGGNVLIGGDSGSLSIALMRWQCLYIILIALNGILESFTFAAMNNQMIQTFTVSITGLSVLCLSISTYTVQQYGCQGFVLGNCLNMLFRIVYSLYQVQKICCRGFGRIVGDIFPSKLVLLSCSIAFMILYLLNRTLLSHRLLQPNMLSTVLLYLCSGGGMFLLHIFVIYYCEKRFVHVIRDNFYGSKKND